MSEENSATNPDPELNQSEMLKEMLSMMRDMQHRVVNVERLAIENYQELGKLKSNMLILEEQGKQTREAAVDALKYLIQLEEKVDVLDKDLKAVNSKVDVLEENDKRIEAKVDTLIVDVKAVKETTRLQQREINQVDYKTAVMRLDIDQIQDKLAVK